MDTQASSIAGQNISFISQYTALPKEWGSRGCGLVALKIVLDYWHDINEKNVTLPLPDLLTLALTLGAYKDGIGWSHAGLAELAAGLGYHAWNRDLPREFQGVVASQALFVLREDIASGPVLVSIWKNFNPEEKGGHIVIAHAINDDEIALIDPEKTQEADGRYTISIADFKKGFKMRSICVLPN